jgi:hypothetical protein
MVESESVTQLPFQFTVQGSFVNILSLVETLEQPESKLAVNSFALNMADSEKGELSATVGVVTYAKPVVPGKESKLLAPEAKAVATMSDKNVEIKNVSPAKK